MTKHQTFAEAKRIY